jgi:amino acid adenylation domain-containing protein
MKSLFKIYESFSLFHDRTAFFISGKSYSYSFLLKRIVPLQAVIRNADVIGISMEDHIDTYASIFAAFFSGKTFVPLNPQNPIDRNSSIALQAAIQIIFCAEEKNLPVFRNLNNAEVVWTEKIEPSIEKLLFEELTPPSTNAYILFTSGSTGQPKGVPIMRKNLDAFANAFFDLGYQLSEADRFLQMFDLTFDLSIMSYFVPLTIGASIYTVPFSGIKYTNIYQLLEEHNLTFALMVPSIINQLKPYFDEIKLEKMRYCLFCGEALHEDMTSRWSQCIPNARIDNVYGPTEATIFCTCYTYKKKPPNKSVNGILCIGKPMKNNFCFILNDDDSIVKANEKGELCLAGEQLTEGYINNEEKNKEVFLTVRENQKTFRIYRSGDICYKDNDGDIFYIGRKDSQIKIQGFRVELSEIEHHARTFLKQHAVAVIARKNDAGNTVIELFIENYNQPTNALVDFLKTKMPVYMLPTKIISLPVFPLNANGKTDRNALLAI